MTYSKDLASLGFSSSPTLAELKSRYRQLVLDAHPDRGGDVGAFQAINEAYARLLVEAEKPRPCPRCEGTGKQYVGTGFTQFKMTCQLCGGDGKEKSTKT